MAFQTEFNFTLPRGYIDKDGNVHKEGTMRLANAADEILPLKDPRAVSYTHLATENFIIEEDISFRVLANQYELTPGEILKCLSLAERCV